MLSKLEELCLRLCGEVVRVRFDDEDETIESTVCASYGVYLLKQLVRNPGMTKYLLGCHMDFCREHCQLGCKNENPPRHYGLYKRIDVLLKEVIAVNVSQAKAILYDSAIDSVRSLASESLIADQFPEVHECLEVIRLNGAVVRPVQLPLKQLADMYVTVNPIVCSVRAKEVEKLVYVDKVVVKGKVMFKLFNFSC